MIPDLDLNINHFHLFWNLILTVCEILDFDIDQQLREQ